MRNLTRKRPSGQPPDLGYLTEIRHLVTALAALVTAIGGLAALVAAIGGVAALLMR